MKQYVYEYVSLCGQMCKSADDYTSQKNVRQHNQAMTKMMRLTEQLRDDISVARVVYGELLDYEDLFVRQCAASDCLGLGIHTDQAVKVLKMICRKDDRMAAMAAKRSLAIWKGKLDPNSAF